MIANHDVCMWRAIEIRDAFAAEVLAKFYALEPCHTMTNSGREPEIQSLCELMEVIDGSAFDVHDSVFAEFPLRLLLVAQYHRTGIETKPEAKVLGIAIEAEMMLYVPRVGLKLLFGRIEREVERIVLLLPGSLELATIMRIGARDIGKEDLALKGNIQIARRCKRIGGSDVGQLPLAVQITDISVVLATGERE